MADFCARLLSAAVRGDAGVDAEVLFPHPELGVDDGVEFAAGDAGADELFPHPDDDGGDF